MAIDTLFFDVFGTLVDWRGSIAREAEVALASRGVTTDWPAFADAWRGAIQPADGSVRSGKIPFSKLDALHRPESRGGAPRFNVSRPGRGARAPLNLAWHRLDAWPDVRRRLAAPEARAFASRRAPRQLSLMVDLARRNGLPWDVILGAEWARDYKPKPGGYLVGGGALDLGARASV